MNIYENLKNNLSLVTYPSTLWATHVDNANSTIAIIHLKSQETECINIDKALIIKMVNNCLKVLTLINNEKTIVPQLSYNLHQLNDVSNMLFALENYSLSNLPLNNLHSLEYNDNSFKAPTDNNFPREFETNPKYYDSNTNNYNIIIQKSNIKWQCEFCNKISKSRTSYQQHLRTHGTNKSKQFLCSSCGKHIRSKSHLMEHLVTHSLDKRIPCNMCTKTFSTTSNLKAHIKTHSGDRSHVCTTCGKAYTTSSNLRTHVRSIHRNDKPHACNCCEMRFVHPRALRLHMLKHTRERPFKCTFCNKSFPKKIHLTVHIRTHTGEKPYCCMTCGKSCTTSGNLNSHMKIHKIKIQS